MTTSDVPRFRRYAAEERAAMLVRAGLECLAEGGITAFTVDNICRRAEASRGLIAHHFGGKEGLLAAVYEAAYQPMLARIDPGEAPLPLGQLLDVLGDAEATDRATMNIWLALWGEVAVNPALQAAHRRNYTRYKGVVELAIEDHAHARGLRVDAGALAATLIALVDGQWLQRCIDPQGFDAGAARTARRSVAEAALGALED